ncbi:tetratricopeptide repeat protein [Pendulispora rubella]|uniref:Tetratricopeptide repeat protein n=1 Tax=Pendulispora rubella TaxID=2741070 RepID=A0ABZ2L418_9BACT
MNAGIVFLASAMAVGANPLDPYDEAMARSTAQERSGDLDAALRTLESTAAAYPQDYAVVARMGDLALRFRNYTKAKEAYRMALERSPRAAGARAGLGWALAYLGSCGLAREQFLVALELEPEHASARDGISYCTSRETPAFGAAAGLGVSAYFYPNHAFRDYGGSAIASLDVSHRAGWTAGGAYRYTFGAQRSYASWEQHDAYFNFGYAGKNTGAIAHYAAVFDRSGFSGTSHHMGLSARWSAFGDVRLEASLSVYHDMNVFRAAPSWKIPLLWGFSVEPGTALQRTNAQWLATPSLTLMLERAWGSLAAGGKYGDEVRPAYLGARIVANIPERISWGWWIGGTWNAGRGLRVHLSYATNRLQLVDVGSSDAHFVTLSFSKSF